MIYGNGLASRRRSPRLRAVGSILARGRNPYTGNASGNRWEKHLGSARRFLSRSFGAFTAGVRFLSWAVLITWGTLAIYYSNLPWPGLRLGLAAAFAAFAVWASGCRAGGACLRS